MEQTALLETLKEEEKLLLELQIKLKAQLQKLKTEELSLLEMIITSKKQLGSDDVETSSISNANYRPTLVDPKSCSNATMAPSYDDDPTMVNQKPLHGLLPALDTHNMSSDEEESESDLVADA
ncbi:hypothetical protein TrispH2_009916 [Trichoplax sp. H2]|uniref:snRNA-activating protein complex subunit 5 n=1 Tax=Trichoplax adhaerens TaxID=10228 RepID=B3RSQ7_TRIAD|nr:predicted protein [Trichoplax adhaerens]EDV26559.1 predicted protein [Trichoplax adhaerens]RDD37673.1 hypothetical protein TrispH2_009916 [Trichoplax sp. H2]|eukprot:XP_002110555.1 predicted protein [Trichoplax adhaerens]